MFNKKQEYKVKGYTNKWSVIDTIGNYSLFENNTYGDETCYLVICNFAKIEDRKYRNSKTGKEVVLPTILEVVAETYDDLETALEDNDLIIR